MATIADLPDDPKHTIKTVCTQTGIRAVTLRAWERRHEVLTPHRSENRYRLYSDRDIAILQWIKNRVDNGISISNAASEMRNMLKNGVWPDVIMPTLHVPRERSTTPPGDYVRQLFEALISHDEARAGELLRSVTSIFELRTVCVDVLIPLLVEIGEAWYNGKIRVTTEHFASVYIRGRLLSLLQTYPTRRTAPHILLGCAPTEQHEIGTLMVAVLLRSAGYRVEFLGPDLPVEDLVDYASYERPNMIILSATMEDAAEQLTSFQKQLSKLRTRPLFGFGGRAFNNNSGLRDRMGGVFLGDNLDDAIDTITKLLPISIK
jgi:MerR family transcriptional regulator, light-induced transcriptional regulator